MVYNWLKTKKAINGYKYSNGSGGFYEMAKEN